MKIQKMTIVMFMLFVVMLAGCDREVETYTLETLPSVIEFEDANFMTASFVMGPKIQFDGFDVQLLVSKISRKYVIFIHSIVRDRCISYISTMGENITPYGSYEVVETKQSGFGFAGYEIGIKKTSIINHTYTLFYIPYEDLEELVGNKKGISFTIEGDSTQQGEIPSNYIKHALDFKPSGRK